jgi:hypothetical protein
MQSAFEPMSPRVKAQFRDAYLAYLRGRDGTPDLRAKRFDRRERFFAEIDADPVCWEGAPPVDQAVFDRNYARSKPEAGLDERTLWALATAKTNRGERYGVEYSLAHGRHPTDPSNDPHSFIQVEEVYHTRILEDALRTIGVHTKISAPNVATRVLVRGMVRMPDQVSDVLVLCGEIFGVAVFSLLLDKARSLFAEQPRALARIEALFAQIMVDEVGHVHFVRSRLRPELVALSRRIAPLVALGAMSDIPELLPLFGKETILQRTLAADVDAAAAPYEDRFVLPSA